MKIILLIIAIAFAMQSVDWSSVAKTWGPLGIVFVLFLLLVVGFAQFTRKYLTKKDEDSAKLVSDTIADNRKERDRMGAQLERQAKEFTEHIRSENEHFRSALKDVVDGFERTARRR